MSQSQTAAEPIIMGRIRQDLLVSGIPCWTLFDSGARQSYIRRGATVEENITATAIAWTTALAGHQHEITDSYLINTLLNDKPFTFHANVIETIGVDESGKSIDLIVGALAMQEWGIKLDLPAEQLDLTHFTDEFIEF